MLPHQPTAKEQQLELFEQGNAPRQGEVFEHTKSGIRAGQSGAQFECAILGRLYEAGYTPMKEREYDPDVHHGKRVALLEAHYTTVYGRDGYTEFVLVSPEGRRFARVEAKFQSHKGSSDNKIAFWLLNAIYTMPEPVQVLVVGSKQPVQDAWGDIMKFVPYYGGRITAGRPELQGKDYRVMTLPQLEAWLSTQG